MPCHARLFALDSPQEDVHTFLNQSMLSTTPLNAMIGSCILLCVHKASRLTGGSCQFPKIEGTQYGPQIVGLFLRTRIASLADHTGR